MWTHKIAAPILLPLLSAAVLLLIARRGAGVQRGLALASTLLCCALSLALASEASAGAIAVYRVGDWPVPFGIALVSDRLSAIMLVLTDVVALVSIAQASRGVDRDGRHFHALFQFQLAGIHGALLAGDLFNLFVFFEILLIASYCLLLHGGGAPRLRAALHYVILNLIGSSIFLLAIGAIYAATGALNMAHIAVRVRELGAEDAALIRAAGLLALVVFGLKAAVVPLHFWLPRAYPTAAPPVAALFAIMSKVGVYCCVRVSTLIFGADAGVGAELAGAWLLPGALITQLVAVLGALGSADLRRLASYLLINSVGVMLAGVALATEAALSAALYYLVHSTLAVAAMFLLADHVARARGGAGDALEPGPPLARAGLLGAGFLIASLGLVGLPPFPGFIGKAALLLAAPRDGAGVALWCAVLGGGFASLLACMRAGSALFWDADPALAPARVPRAGSLPWLALLGSMGLLALLSGPAMELARATASQLLEPSAYVRAVFSAR